MCHRCLRNCVGCECPIISPSGWQFLLTDVSITWRRVTSPPSFNRRAMLVTGIQFNCSSCVEQFANGSAVFWVTGHFSTPPENWTVWAFLQLTLRLSNDFTAAWFNFTFLQLFAVAATLKSINYNVAMTFIFNNNNNNYGWQTNYVLWPFVG